MSTHKTNLTLATTGLLVLFTLGAGAQTASTTHKNSSSTRHVRHHRRLAAAKRSATRSMTVYHYNPKANGGFTTYQVKTHVSPARRTHVATQIVQPAGPDDTQTAPMSGSVPQPARSANVPGNANRSGSALNTNYGYTAAGTGPTLYVAPVSPYIYGGTSITPSVIDLGSIYAYGYGLNAPITIGTGGLQYLYDNNSYNGFNGYSSAGNDENSGAPATTAAPAVAPNGEAGNPSGQVVAPNATVVNPPGGAGVYDNTTAPALKGVQNGNGNPNFPNPSAMAANIQPASSVVTTSLEAGNRIRLHWIGPTDGLVRSTFMMLDSRRRVVRSKTVVGPPTEILFPRSNRHAYYAVRLYFNTGSTRTLVSPF